VFVGRGVSVGVKVNVGVNVNVGVTVGDGVLEGVMVKVLVCFGKAVWVNVAVGVPSSRFWNVGRIKTTAAATKATIPATSAIVARVSLLIHPLRTPMKRAIERTISPPAIPIPVFIHFES